MVASLNASPHGHELRVVLALKREFIGEHALKRQYSPHLGEHVGGHRALDVARERNAHPQVERLLKRRRPVAHVHFDRHGEGDVGAGVGGGRAKDFRNKEDVERSGSNEVRKIAKRVPSPG